MNQTKAKCLWQKIVVSCVLLGLSGCTGRLKTPVLSDGEPPGVDTQTLTFSPPSGAVGNIITLTGTDFTTVSEVTVSGTPATALTATSTSLSILVMPGTSSGAIRVTTDQGTLESDELFTVTATGVPATQQGSKLIGAGAIGAAGQGSSVAVSADGNTMAFGGPSDNTNIGAVWVYTRSGSTWTQQGSKLVGTGGIGSTTQGTSVALSADGNTMAVGGYGDNGYVGAVWIFTRTGSTWSQQGAKLVGSNPVGVATIGNAVSLSADGNTLAVGGSADNSDIGAAWIFVRIGSAWSQLGSKIIPTGGTGTPEFGSSVTLSADGNTFAIGGYKDNSYAGGTWIYTRSGSVWTQQGAKLLGSGNVGSTGQGFATALSADGNTLAIGGYRDNNFFGATWIFTRSAGVWTQQGSKLIGTGSTGSTPIQGQAVKLSADGDTLAIGGVGDDTNLGAAWIFSRTGTSWAQVGTKLIGSGYVGASRQGNVLALSQDGSTLVSTGYYDNTNTGAAWIFTP